MAKYIPNCGVHGAPRLLHYLICQSKSENGLVSRTERVLINDHKPRVWQLPLYCACAPGPRKLMVVLRAKSKCVYGEHVSGQKIIKFIC